MRWAYVGFPTFCNEKKVIRTNNLQPQCCDQLRLDSAEFLKKRNRIPPLRLCFEGNVIEGSLSYLTYLFGRKWRPSPQCPRLQPLLGKCHQTSSWLNRSPLAADQRCRLCSRGIGPTST